MSKDNILKVIIPCTKRVVDKMETDEENQDYSKKDKLKVCGTLLIDIILWILVCLALLILIPIAVILSIIAIFIISVVIAIIILIMGAIIMIIIILFLIGLVLSFPSICVFVFFIIISCPIWCCMCCVTFMVLLISAIKDD